MVVSTKRKIEEIIECLYLTKYVVTIKLIIINNK